MTNFEHEQLKHAISQARARFKAHVEENPCVKIYDLLPLISGTDIYSWSNEALVALFQKNFVIQAALIELQEFYRCEKSSAKIKTLLISPIEVKLIDAESFERKEDPFSNEIEEASIQVVLEFYRDYTQFFAANADTVASLLESFWSRFSGFDGLDEAFECLGLNNQVSWQDVQNRYRELATTHHPDKGGNAGEFIRVRKAYEKLKLALR